MKKTPFTKLRKTPFGSTKEKSKYVGYQHAINFLDHNDPRLVGCVLVEITLDTKIRGDCVSDHHVRYGRIPIIKADPNFSLLQRRHYCKFALRMILTNKHFRSSNTYISHERQLSQNMTKQTTLGRTIETNSEVNPLCF